MRVTQWLDELRDDLKSAFRQLRHSPAFTLVATLTLALGIGANSARDFGLRRALGASSRDILRLVMGNAARVIVTGAVIGLVLSAIFGRVLETMLFGVRPYDVTTYALVVLVLGITAAISIAGSAWRAMRVDHAVALRDR